MQREPDAPRVPRIDVAPLFAPDARAREAADAAAVARAAREAVDAAVARAAREAVDVAVARAAREAGFLTLTGLPDTVPLGAAARAALLRVFDLPPAEKRRLWRKASAPGNPNVYRGYFPLESGVIKEGMDVGPDHAGGGAPGDALAEPTPWPEEAALPGWRDDVRRAYAGLEAVGQALMGSLARGLGLDERVFDEPFRGGNSTLRLLAYPPWPPIAARHGLALRPLDSPDGVRRYDIGGEHVDSGFVTLLQQDDTGGLQARLAGDAWVDVPPVEGALVVNFGKLLERWTGGRIRATEHRVLGNDRERHSIPFFFEPRIDARIAPLPLEGAEDFEPFTYGDHLWDAMTKFVEFQHATRWPEDARNA